jgi:hypothetical protein
MDAMFWLNVAYFLVRFASQEIRNFTNDNDLKALPQQK